MLPSHVLFRAFVLLLPPCLLSLVYLYTYPAVHGCGFPTPGSVNDPLERACAAEGSRSESEGPPNGAQCGERTLNTWGKWMGKGDKAPFRLLALGDPQLEGDSSIPSSDGIRFPSVKEILARDRYALKKLWESVSTETSNRLLAVRKIIDLWGNDWYLAHIYRTLNWWSQPTHVTVLGDLLGSQWVSDEEFERRSLRFWTRVFKGTRKVEEEIMNDRPGRIETLGVDKSWRTKIINVVGNHDIGYAGDLNEDKVDRFERNFGRVNWAIKFSLYNLSRGPDDDNVQYSDSIPTIRLVNLNSMNLDGPALSGGLQGQTYDFINGIIVDSHQVEDRRHLTVLLTHIPLHKEAGVCVDAPFFDFWADGTGIQEQNHLGADTSKGAILEGLYGLSGNPEAAAGGRGRKGVILNGHDHEGCDVFHHIKNGYLPVSDADADNNPDQPKQTHPWKATRFSDAQRQGIINDESNRGIREITVRSMMGEFGGNAALMSAWWNDTIQEWEYDVSMCAVGVQHIWWGIHIFAFGEVCLLLTAVVTHVVQSLRIAMCRESVGKDKEANGTAEKTAKNEENHAHSSAVQSKKGTGRRKPH